MNIGGTSTHRQLGELAFQARLQRHLDDVAVGQSARSAAVATEVKERDAEAQDFLSHTAPDALTRYLVLTGHMSYGERAMAATAISRRATRRTRTAEGRTAWRSSTTPSSTSRLTVRGRTRCGRVHRAAAPRTRPSRLGVRSARAEGRFMGGAARNARLPATLGRPQRSAASGQPDKGAHDRVTRRPSV